MGFRFAFAIYASSVDGEQAVARFSVQHAITGAHTWTTALVLMAFGEVLARVLILQARRLYVKRGSAGDPRRALAY